jgi:hypothetical protein
VANALDNLARQVEEQNASQANVKLPNNVLSSAQFKKKEVPTKSARRKNGLRWNARQIKKMQ